MFPLLLCYVLFDTHPVVDALSCLEHVAELCDCDGSSKVLRYRYTLEEMPHMIHQLRVRAESYDNWSTQAKKALTTNTNEDRLCKFAVVSPINP